jgi:predicted alpha-1,6-mannanase (GH76 family)
LSIACVVTAVPRSVDAHPALAASAATVAMNRLDADFYDAHAGLYRITGGQHEPYAALWPTSQVLNGAIGVARLTHAPADLARVRRIIASLQVYATTDGAFHARTIRSLRYYDDNNWVALDLLDAYALLHDQDDLTLAERVFAFLVSGWDAKHGGGIIWADGHPDRPTVSTAPAITVGLRLAAVTHQASYRAWAQRLYDWENSTMRAPNGLYWDHIQADGKIDKDIVSYNQGVMIDANVAFAALTAQGHYLAEARRIADAASRALPGPWRDHGRYAAFDAIYFQALAHLNAASANAASLAPARDYLTWAVPTAQASRPANSRTEEDLLEQAAFVITATSVGG